LRFVDIGWFAGPAPPRCAASSNGGIPFDYVVAINDVIALGAMAPGAARNEARTPVQMTDDNTRSEESPVLFAGRSGRCITDQGLVVCAGAST
jgi:hypothetical protein